MKVYPNPSQGKFQLNLENTEFSEISTMYLFDCRGKTIHFDKANFLEYGMLNLSDKEKGIYYFTLIIDGESYQVKLIVQ